MSHFRRGLQLILKMTKKRPFLSQGASSVARAIRLSTNLIRFSSPINSQLIRVFHVPIGLLAAQISARDHTRVSPFFRFRETSLAAFPMLKQWRKKRSSGSCHALPLHPIDPVSGLFDCMGRLFCNVTSPGAEGHQFWSTDHHWTVPA